MTDADKERSSKDESKRLLKVAATYSPTIYRSAVPSAMLSLAAALAPPCLAAPLSPASARSASLRSLPRPRAAGAHTAARPAPLMHFSQPNDHPSLMTT